VAAVAITTADIFVADEKGTTAFTVKLALRV